MALFFFILQGVCFAGVAVSPLQQWVDVKPGRKTTFSITVTNNKRNEQDQPCPIRVDVLDFTVSENGQLSFGPEHTHPRSAVDWISTEDNKIVLEPGESREIKFNVSAPANSDGDYWATAMVELGKTREGEKGVQVKFRTASGIFIHVAKRNYIERGSVIDAKVDIPEFNTTDGLSAKNTEETASEDIRKERVLKINAELKNDGLVSFLARGKAYLYSDGWRRVATIPLHAKRRRVLPGDSRWFTGVMAEPLPAGQYKLRTFFASDSKYKRKMTRDMEFEISEDLAGIWAENFVNEDGQSLNIKPQQIELKLTPGRLTAARFQVFNQSLSTIVANCRIENDKANNDWLELKTEDFTLAPNAQRSTTCLIKVPSDTLPGRYNWTIHVETERSGLTTKEQDNIKHHQIPVCVVIDENIPTLASRQE